MYRHHRAVDREIKALVERRIPERILLIELPPRHGKSELVSHWLPAWVQSNWPHWQVGVISYGEAFAKNFGRKARNSFVEACKYTQLKPDPRRDSATDWGVLGYPSGGMISAGLNGSITGRGFNVLIADDLIKNSEEALSERHRQSIWEWWQSTAFIRLEPDGVVIVMATRWHVYDLTGRLIKAAQDGSGLPVRRVRLPALAEKDDPLSRMEGEAIWPERWPVSRLKEIKDSVEAYWWNTQYQQRPTQHVDAEWPAEYFDDIWVDAMPTEFELSCIFVDASKGTEKGDYSAITFAGFRGNTIYLDCDLERRPTPQIIEDTARMADDYRPEAVGFESDCFQELLCGDYEAFQRETGCGMVNVVAQPTQGVKKEIRIRRLGIWMKQKRIKFVRSRGSTLTVQQMKDFPLADHDDGPDSVEGAVRLLNSMAREIIDRPSDRTLVLR